VRGFGDCPAYVILMCWYPCLNGQGACVLEACVSLKGGTI
jgi:hypothetical protein